MDNPSAIRGTHFPRCVGNKVPGPGVRQFMSDDVDVLPVAGYDGRCGKSCFVVSFEKMYQERQRSESFVRVV